MRRELASLPDDIAAMPPSSVVLGEYPALALLKDSAVGPLFYVGSIFDAEPGLVVLASGGQSPHPDLRSLVERVSRDGQPVFVESRAEADARIRDFQG